MQKSRLAWRYIYGADTDTDTNTDTHADTGADTDADTHDGTDTDSVFETDDTSGLEVRKSLTWYFWWRKSKQFYISQFFRVFLVWPDGLEPFTRNRGSN